MAQITLTGDAKPAFLSKNYINRDSVAAAALVVSTGDLLKHRLYANDFTAQWSSAASDDTITETITIGLYQGALQADRSIDFIALMNINLKNFLLEYSANNGATYTTVTGGDYQVATGNYASTNLILSLAAPITANKLRLSMYRTTVANAEKLVGGFVAALGTFQTDRGMTAYEPERRENRRDVRMSDGSLSYGVQYRSDNSIQFYDAKAGWRFVTTAERVKFYTEKNRIEPFLWYPEPADAPLDLFLARIKPRTFKDPYSSTYKGAGYDISFELEEVGGG